MLCSHADTLTQPVAIHACCSAVAAEELAAESEAGPLQLGTAPISVPVSPCFQGGNQMGSLTAKQRKMMVVLLLLD